MGCHAQASRMEIQNEYVKLILSIILKYIKKGKDHVHHALEFMDNLGLTNEHLKEHLMQLCMDNKTIDAFDGLDSGTKAAFTREYNKHHKNDFTGKKVAKGKGRASITTGDDENGEGEEDD